jgi:hypothetical protein
VIVSSPGPATRNVPPVSLAVPIELQGSNTAKTIPFKNVLDGLEAFETSSDENVSGEQKADSQDSTAKNNGRLAGNNGAAAGKSVPGPTPGPQPGTRQIPFHSNQNLVQNLSQPAAALAAPDTSVGPTQKTAEIQQNSSALEGIAPEPAEPAEQGHTESMLPENAPNSDGTIVPSTARFGAGVQTPLATASSGPAKSPAIEAKLVAEQAPAVNAVSTSKAGPEVTPAVTSSEGKPEAKPEAMTKPETATSAGWEPPKLQAPRELRSAIPSRLASNVTAPSQPKSTPVASPEVIAGPSPHRVAANSGAVSRWRPVAAVMPQPPRTSAAGSVSNNLGQALREPAESGTTAPVPAPKELVSKATAARVSPQLRPQAVPATTQVQPAVARAQMVEPAAPATAPPLPVETVPVPDASATTTSAATPGAPPPSTSPNPRDTSLADSMRSNAGGTQNQSDPPQRVANSIDSAAAPAVTHLAAAPAPVAETAASTDERPVSQTPEANVAAESEAMEGAAAAKPQAPLSPQAENFAFAVRMIAPDDAVPTGAQPAVSAAQQQSSQTKPAVTQPAPAQAPQQPGQSETSSNSKIETQSPAPGTEKTDARDSKAADWPQSGQTQETVTRWSDVSAAPLPSEINSALPSSGLAEAAHDSPVLAAQETHLMAPELPRTSASTDILLHLTGDDQSSAAIRVADRAGSVNVSVHAADPVLREALRSNLEQLSTQLTGQGWKADMLKPAAIAAQSESQQDSHSGGQRSSQQQQSFGGQPQRDRRAQAGYWQQELEQQISGGDAQTGGNG